MKNVLIASYDMEIGGVERSLASMLGSFDYGRHAVDLMLYRHRGEFMDLLPEQANLLREISAYATFRQSIRDTFAGGHRLIGLARVASKLQADWTARRKRLAESGYRQQQLMWRYAMPFLPPLKGSYDAAISYLWPHDFVAGKVNARRKIAWIHTDYSTVETDEKRDLRIWDRFDHIVAVSEACRDAFLRKYGSLAGKTVVIENIHSPSAIRALAAAGRASPMEADPRFKLVTVARLSHAKGIDQAVRAYSLLRQRGIRDIAWYVVGYGGDEAAIRELVAGQGVRDGFILLGKQTNPYPYIAAADLYVQPSRYEGKAVTVTEAQILGRPVLITNYATAASQVGHGHDGIIAGMSPEAIADGIELLYRDKEARTRLAAVCAGADYGNSGELDKLYPLIG